MSCFTKSWLCAALVALIMTGYASLSRADYQKLWSLGAIDPDFTPRQCGKGALVAVSWNVANFGNEDKKGRLDAVVSVLRHADIVFVLEVSGSFHGPQSAALLQDALSRTEAKWQMKVSDATSAEPAGKNTVERVVVYWRPDRVKIGEINAGLVSALSGTVAREPFRIETVGKNTGKVEFYSFHARPEGSGAIEEAALVANFVHRNGNVPRDVGTIVLGDFNLSRSQLDKAFVPYGFQGGISGASSLRKKGDGLSRKRDNAYFRNAPVCESGRVRTDKIFGTDSVRVSDHVPIYVVLETN